jgi:hypothetical protein
MKENLESNTMSETAKKNKKIKHNPNESILYTQFDYSNRVRPKLENP